jgi:hypothetical protein
MAVNSTQSITAEEYNSLQSRISQILGTGSDNEGYGQTVLSSQVQSITDLSAVDGDSVLSTQLNNLRDDFNTVVEHQTGSPTDISSFSVGDIVGADQSGTDIEYDQDGNITFVNEDDSKGFNDFISLISDLESNRFDIAQNQQDISTLVSLSRSDSWNGTISATVLVEFVSEDDLRYFFNAGGQIRFVGDVTNVSTQRGTFWNDLIENPGEVQFDAEKTNNTGSDSGVSLFMVGNYDLTSSYQNIFRKDANAGLYSDSFWRIEAREESTKSISFRIILVNDGPESDTDFGVPGGVDGGIQESVQADIEFEISTRRANGVVTVANPDITITNSF